MGNTVSKALLERYIDGYCTPEETAAVEAYLREPGNDGTLQALLSGRLERDMETSMSAEDDPAQKEEWAAKMRARMGRKAKVKRMRVWRYAAMSAAILAGIGVFTLFRFYNKPHQQRFALLEQSNVNGQRSVIRLNDGSVILLGAGSRLAYPASFTGGKREISLHGEAFFEIADDPAHPFVVHTGNIATTVLGTAFRVSAFDGKPLSVAVASGRVRVDYRQGGALRELAVLTPGKQVTWDRGKAELANVAVQDVEGWQKGRLAYNGKSLGEIAADLERWYNVGIRFQYPRKADEKITVTLFGGAPLEKTLQTLAAGSNFKYAVNGRDVLIH